MQSFLEIFPHTHAQPLTLTANHYGAFILCQSLHQGAYYFYIIYSS